MFTVMFMNVSVIMVYSTVVIVTVIVMVILAMAVLGKLMLFVRLHVLRSLIVVHQSAQSKNYKQKAAQAIYAQLHVR